MNRVTRESVVSQVREIPLDVVVWQYSDVVVRHR